MANQARNVTTGLAVTVTLFCPLQTLAADDRQVAVLLGFGSDSRFAVQAAVDGAAARLSRPGCQEVLADFADESGHSLRTRLLARGTSPVEAFAALRFVDSRRAPQCSTSSTLAFAQTGSPVIHVCGQQFVQRFMRNRRTAEIIVIHEFLHAIGLGENPPTSQAITAQVALRCSH
jgi:hypothetical protein